MDWDSITWQTFQDVLIQYRTKFYRGRYNEEQHYLDIFQELVGVPIRAKAIHSSSIVLFLNRWHCRLAADKASRAIRDWLLLEAENLERLVSVNIADVDVIQMEQESERLHNSLIALRGGDIEIGIHNMSDACASKILHLTIPSLFVMWDKNIKPRGCNYGAFMGRMHELACRLKTELAPPAAQDDLEAYLQNTLRYPVRKPLAKYIDEYNWYVTVGHLR